MQTSIHNEIFIVYFHSQTSSSHYRDEKSKLWGIVTSNFPTLATGVHGGGQGVNYTPKLWKIDLASKRFWKNSWFPLKGDLGRYSDPSPLKLFLIRVSKKNHSNLNLFQPPAKTAGS